MTGRERSFQSKAHVKAHGGVKEHNSLRENEKLQHHWLMAADGDDHGKVERGQVVKNLNVTGFGQGGEVSQIVGVKLKPDFAEHSRYQLKRVRSPQL